MLSCYLIHNQIGVMRKGRLLVENSPDNLMKQFNCDLLEQVVLKLCQKDELLAIGCVANANQGHSNFLSSTNKPQEIIPPEAIIINGEKANVRNSYSNLKNSCNTREENWQLYNGQRSLTNMDENEAVRKITTSSSSMFQRIRALSTVMWLLLFRHPSFTCITIFVPAIQILLTVAVIGKDPKGIKLGIVNQEFPEFPDPCLNYKGMRNRTEVFDGLQQNLCDYKQLSCSFISELKKSGNVETIPTQSSELAYQQVKEGKLLGYVVFPPNYSEHLANLKVEQMFARNETLEGSRVRMRLDMSNRKQGTLERARVAGLQFKEVMGSYMVTQVSIIILQALICYGLMRAVHDMQVLGSMTLYFGVTLLFGVCALSMGLFLGIFMGDEVEALVFAMFLGPALIFFEGALWPLEAIPWIPWRILSYASPTTLMCSSFRSIVTRGLGLTHPLVWPGIAVVAGYTVLFCALSALFFVRKTK
ncbi:unnamed protein product [Orchesella dallaii]|uniref:ABC-2 type transporter transmembrane domain-containing protein n=1 Tax=Orchesella dallaii TaxID=48710 RepID=A0ABP1R978_9HEXA